MYDKVSTSAATQLGVAILAVSAKTLISASLFQVLAGVSASPVKKFLFDRAMAAKLSDLRRYKWFLLHSLVHGEERRGPGRYHCS